MKEHRFVSPALLSIIPLLMACLMPICRAEETKPLRVLVTYGGHGFQQKEFFAMWDALPGVTYTKAEMPKEADLFKPGLEKRFDVIVMYDMTKGFTPQQRKGFTALLDTGLGLVSTHHNLGAHRDWPGFSEIIGGKYVFKPEMIDGKMHEKSTYAHDQALGVRIIDKEHPITKGLADFVIHDETYGNFYVAPDAEILMTTEHPKCGRDIAWTKKSGKSRVCYFIFGHDSKSWQNPAYRDVLGRAIRWAAPKAPQLR